MSVFFGLNKRVFTFLFTPVWYSDEKSGMNNVKHDENETLKKKKKDRGMVNGFTLMLLVFLI